MVETGQSPHARLRPVPATAVSLSDAFWAPRLKINREATIPGQYRHCEETGRIDNFRVASGRKEGRFEGIFFNDSDVYKWVEAASFAVADGESPRLAHILEMVIEEIAAAQQPDGYLNTYFMGVRAAERWTNLKDMHELYCAGHLLQAAVAHHRATGAETLLRVATRVADGIGEVFGPGKRPGACGHPEIELALVELSRETGEPRYLALAQFFIDARGHGTLGGGDYHQDHRPFAEQSEATGHAVRMLYLCAGATDVVLETGDAAYRAALDRIWANLTERRLYVSGGAGSRWEGEAFGGDFELPSARAYSETCAAIGLVMWAWRMLQAAGDARYADQLEHTLYNAVLPGLALDGQTYFYQNPLEDDGRHRRQPWFGCACCPPNVARTLAALPAYFYSRSPEGIWIHLYAMGSADLRTPAGRQVIVNQYTNYPWEGEIRVELEGAVEGREEFSIFLRIPGWAAGATMEVNGAALDPPPASGAYAEIRSRWSAGDEIKLSLPMGVRRLSAHPRVAENRGRVALMRGPLLFCVEGVDHPGADVRDLVLPPDAELSATFRPDLLGGTMTLAGRALVRPVDPQWQGVLYGPAAPERAAHPVDVVAIPYALWANRTAGPMTVWIREGAA